MKIIFPLVVAIMLLGCTNDKKEKQETVIEKIEMPATDSTLVTDSTWGLIKKSTDFGGLQTVYGIANVKDERICGAECLDSVDVTIIYPGSNREFIVYWGDSSYHHQIVYIRCYTAGAPYHTAGGIRMGTTLKDLLQMNGKPIAFSGFGWDYGGGIISLNNGVLDRSNVMFNLDLSESTETNSVYGDTELNSDMPVVKKLLDKIRVSELFLSLTK